MYFRNFTMQDGLPHNQITCITKDALGFMWMGTVDGLCRFDGRSFVTFKHRNTKTRSICGNQITRVVPYGSEHLLIATADGGFCKLNIHNFSIKHYSISDAATRFIYNILDVAVDDDGNIYMTADKAGLWFVHRNDSVFIKVPLREVDNERSIYTINKKGNDLILGFVGGCYSIFNLTKQLQTYSFSSEKEFPFPSHTVNQFLYINDSVIASAAWDNALHFIDLQSNSLASFPLDNTKQINYSNDEIICLERVGQTIWCGTRNNGLHFFDLDKKSFSDLKIRHVANALIHTTVLSMYRDEQQRMWVGTNKGLFLYDPLLNQFTVHRVGNDSESNDKVNTFLLNSDHTFWVGTNTGLYLYDEAFRFIKKQPIPFKGEPHSVTSLFRDHHNNIYVGTTKTIYVYRADGTWVPVKNNSNTSFGFDIENIASSRVHDITFFPYANDTLIILSIYGYSLQLIEPHTFTARLVHLYGNNRFENLIRKFYWDSNGRLNACGASIGLIQQIHWEPCDTCNPLPASINYFKDYANELTLKGTVQSIDKYFNADVYDYFARGKRRYVSMPGKGLFIYDGVKWMNAHNLSSSERLGVQGIYVTANDNVFVINSGAVEFFNATDNSFVRFDQFDGLPTDGVHGYFTQGPRSSILVPGYGYFIAFSPSSLILNNKLVPLYCTQIRSNSLNIDTVQLSPKVCLAADDNLINLSFAALDYTSSTRIIYEYYLEGIHNNWLSNGVNATITFIKPASGSYKLHVRALNHFGQCITKEMMIPFVVLAPWYRQTWFFVLLLLLIVLLGNTFYRWRRNQWERLLQMRARIARDLHDDVGSALGSISFYTEAAKMQLTKSEPAVAKQTLEHIGETSRETIETIKDIVWTVNPENDSLPLLVERMRNLLSDVCAAHLLTYSFDDSALSSTLKLTLEERRNLYLIFKEALYNALKYSGTKSIEVTLHSKTSRLTFVLRDHGTGLPHTFISGNGIKNMKHRAAEIKASIQMVNENGLHIILTLP